MKRDGLVSFMMWLYMNDRECYDLFEKKIKIYIDSIKGGKNNG